MAEEKKPEGRGRTVLIAMDGSKHAIHAFEWYVENVYKPTDKVIMAHTAERLTLPQIATQMPEDVSEEMVVTATAMMAGNPTAVQAMVKDHDEHVTEVFRTIDNLANKHNVKHILEKLQGEAGSAIVKAAESQNVDMIIVGSRGFGTIRRTILGSVSDYIVHHAHVPVMVCKHEDEHHKLPEHK